ncbi:MAG TPA: nucleotide disphospho-sugar-binding domain-containing protein [Solirubrobacteraceae bacterium]|nr:nucleotide disphospho-sugar-binding domain-containing protein [Solirubrobacteraceae bacterium]
MAALAERGHQASVCTLSDELEHLRQMGIEASPIDRLIEDNQLKDWRERSPISGALSVLSTIAARADGDARDLERAIARQNPDVLLVDINCRGAAAAAEASGRPWAIYSPYLLPLPSRDAPPVGLGFAPIDGPLGLVRNAVANRLASTFLDRRVMPSINALRLRHGLPPLGRYRDLLERPPLLLVLTAEGFEYPRSDWPANARLVGPVNWAPPLQTPAWLANASDPLVLVTCSTERQDDERLVRVALQALPSAGMSVIATTAAHDPRGFDAPPGSRVVRFLPHEAVLERAACVVCHGGMGITQKALAAGVPVVAVPFRRDQHDTARRVEVAEAGARLSSRRLTPDRLLDAVRTAMGRRAGAQRVSRAYAEAGGQAAAADAIEAIGRQPRNHSGRRGPSGLLHAATGTLPGAGGDING